MWKGEHFILPFVIKCGALPLGALLSALLAIAITCSMVATRSAFAFDGTVTTFSNPLLPSGPDPWVAQYGREYYFLSTENDRISIRKVTNVADVRNSPPITVWVAPREGPNSASIWAPELHRINDRWYIYYTGSDKNNNKPGDRWIFALGTDSDDPVSANWIDLGKVNTKYPGIDGTIFPYLGKIYLIYSAFIRPDSVLVLAEMKGITQVGNEVVIARPDRAWERLEGTQILQSPEFLLGSKGDLIITYGAGTCRSDDASIGMLNAPAGSNPLDPNVWIKRAAPIFTKDPERKVFGVGQGGFFLSPDQKQGWYIYHANPRAGMKCSQKRSPRIQPFTFDSSGFPYLGRPVSAGKLRTKP